MENFYRFQSIAAFGTFQKHIKKQLNRGLKSISIRGTVKLHGANSSVVVERDGSYTVCSRDRAIGVCDPDPLNMNIMYSKIGQETIQRVASQLIGDADKVVLYGELIGRGVQHNVAVSEIERCVVLFQATRVYEDGTMEDVDIESLVIDDSDYFNIYDFGVFEGTFTDFEELQTFVSACTNDVDRKCPVGCFMAPSSKVKSGEGVVWKIKLQYEDGTETTHTVKSKGTSHKRASGVQIAKRDNELNDIQNKALDNFIQITMNNDRLEQGFDYLKSIGATEFTIAYIGDYIKWVKDDIAKEHQDDVRDILIENLVAYSHATKQINELARKYYYLKIKHDL